MASCCRTRCSCVITAGTQVTVTGDGSGATPYVINASPGGATTALGVGDTPSVDATLTGTGTTADPYVVSSAVKLNPTPPAGGSNLIQTSATGLYLECAQVRGCVTAGDGATYDPATGIVKAKVSTAAGNTTVFGADGGLLTPPSGQLTVTDTPSTDLTLTGAGTAASPYVVSSAVKLSADAGNLTKFGADGGVYTPASGQLTVTDTPSTDLTLTGTGTTASPYVVSSAVKLNPTPPAGGSNLIQTSATGLYLECAQVRGCVTAGDGATYDPATGIVKARLSTDAGNGAAIGTDGGLFAPTGGGGAVTCADVRPCISAGDGLDYNATTGVMVAQISADAGNAAKVGTDGGLFAPAGGGALTVTDTPSIDETLTGAGTAASPYVLSAAVKLSADAGNLTKFGADGGVYTPASGQLTVTDTPSTDLTLTGAGTAASPYALTSAVKLNPTPPAGGSNLIQTSATGLYLECAQVRGCVTAGNGLAYDPATGTMTAKLSSTAGNTTVFGADGGLLTPASGQLTVTDTPSIDETLTGAGTTASPYVLSSAVKLSADAGNTTKFGTDGAIYTPPLVSGCGLDGAGTAADPLIVVPSAGQKAWPWACDVTVESGLRCDPATGKLWTPPEHYSAMDHVYVEHFSGGFATPITATGGWAVIDPGANQQWNIPAHFIGNNCRPWAYVSSAMGTWDINYTATAAFQLGYVYVKNGGTPTVRPLWGPVTTLGAARRTRDNGSVYETGWNLPASGTLSYILYPAINVTAGSVTINSWITDATIVTTTNTP